MDEYDRHANQFSDLVAALDKASQDMENTVRTKINPVAVSIEKKFSDVGDAIAKSLSSAADNGSLSMKKLAQNIAMDLARTTIDAVITKPLENALGSLGNGFGGARVAGGFASAGQSFLVGERGPELFVPGRSGHINPQHSALTQSPITVNMNLGQSFDVQTFEQSQSQISGVLSRIISQAQRNA